MILLDASVLIEYLRHRDRAVAAALGELELGICGITRAEVLHRARDANDWQKLTVLLNQFQPIAIPEELWDRVGRQLFELRIKGVTVPFQDAVLATVALTTDTEIWTYDRHFQLMTKVLPLRLFRGPEAGKPLS